MYEIPFKFFKSIFPSVLINLAQFQLIGSETQTNHKF
jgi:hypothetical protein